MENSKKSNVDLIFYILMALLVISMLFIRWRYYNSVALMIGFTLFEGRDYFKYGKKPNVFYYLAMLILIGKMIKMD